MNEEVISAGSKIKFQPTLTLGTLVHVTVLFAVLVTGWVKVNDRIDYDERVLQEQQIMQTKEQEVIQELQVEQARTASILAFVENKIAKEEQIQ